MSQQEKQINANSSNNSSIDAQVIEQGDVYFFYRPKKAAYIFIKLKVRKDQLLIKPLTEGKLE